MSQITTWLRRKRMLRQKETLPAFLTVGRESYGFGERSFLGCSDASPVSIGAFCSIGPEVLFLGQVEHPTGTATTFPLETRYFGSNSRKGNLRYLTSKGPIRIGNDVWIGARATILSGATVGDGAIIAAGAVVVGDIPPYTLAGGVPAKVIRQRFDPDTIRALLQIQWWNWPDAKMRQERAAFSLPAAEFAKRFATPKPLERAASAH